MRTYQSGEYTITEFDDGTTKKVVTQATPSPTPKTQFTHQEMYDRFTGAELAAIYTAAETVVAVAIWLDRFRTAPYIDVTDPRTITGLQSLETAGLVETGRAAIILAVGE